MIAHDLHQWLQFWRHDLPPDAVEQLHGYLTRIYLMQEELVRMKAQVEELRYSGNMSDNH